MEAASASDSLMSPGQIIILTGQIAIQTPIACIGCPIEQRPALGRPTSLACCLNRVGRACAYSCSVQECAARGADAVSARANANARAYVSALRVS